MNCQLCQKEMENYQKGILPEGTRIQVEIHLNTCKICDEVYKLGLIANKVIDKEKEIESNPFLATRVMARIEEMELEKENVQRLPGFQRMLKPALIGISLAAAIFIGVLIGNIYSSNQAQRTLPVEMAYIDDTVLESVDLFAND